MSSQNRGARFFAGLVTGGLVGAGLALFLAPQSGEKTRIQIRDKGLELRDEAAVWQEKGKEVTEAISLSKDSIIQAVSESKDRVVAAVG